MMKLTARAAGVVTGIFLLAGCASTGSAPNTIVPPTTIRTTPQATATGIPARLSTATNPPAAPPVATVPGIPVATPTKPVQPPAEQPVAAETNPVGDISDNQVFVNFRSATGGYGLDVPEGWARTDQGSGARFVDKIDGIEVTISGATQAPTAATAPGNEVVALEKNGRAVQVSKIQDVQLPGGAAVLVEYASNSQPDPVSAKQVRLENNTYFFFKNGKLATLSLWAPLGADNVDQWHQIASSFKWQ